MGLYMNLCGFIYESLFVLHSELDADHVFICIQDDVTAVKLLTIGLVF